MAKPYDPLKKCPNCGIKYSMIFGKIAVPSGEKYSEMFCEKCQQWFRSKVIPLLPQNIG